MREEVSGSWRELKWAVASTILSARKMRPEKLDTKPAQLRKRKSSNDEQQNQQSIPKSHLASKIVLPLLLSPIDRF